MAYRHQLDVLAGDGRSLERTVITPDWQAALPSHVEPVWDARSGPPVTAAFRAVVRSDDGGEMACEIPRTYVRELAQAAGAALAKQGVLAAGEPWRWMLRAYPVAGGPAAREGEDGLALEEIPQALPLSESPLGAFLDRAVFTGANEEAATLAPVFLPERILDEVVIAEGYAHVDVLTAEDGPDNPIVAAIADFLVRNAP
jgi:hypothetical protein